ncbi:hypothetical protein [Micromonospora echinaurantiaca]|uniref:hypothetical protein n=1 Tax=Micromonospora echinaurantiaca TaxID=47857 RepID=UPI00343A8AB4
MRGIIRVIAALLGLSAVVTGVWALVAPGSFSAAVNFPEHRHFVHDVGAFQLGIGATLLLALIWADGLAVALAGYLVGAVAHTASHIIDRDLGGATGQTALIAVFALVAAGALVLRWRELGSVLGRVEPEAAPPWAGRRRTGRTVHFEVRAD